MLFFSLFCRSSGFAAGGGCSTWLDRSILPGWVSLSCCGARCAVGDGSVAQLSVFSVFGCCGLFFFRLFLPSFWSGGSGSLFRLVVGSLVSFCCCEYCLVWRGTLLPPMVF